MRHGHRALRVQVLLRELGHADGRCRCQRPNRVPTVAFAHVARLRIARPASRSPAPRGGTAARCRSPSSSARGSWRRSSARHRDRSRTRTLPFAVSTTITGPAPGVGCASADPAGFAAGFAAGVPAGGFVADAARSSVRCPASVHSSEPRHQRRSSPRAPRARPDLSFEACAFIAPCPPCGRRFWGTARGWHRRRTAGYTGRHTFCPQVTRYRLI